MNDYIPELEVMGFLVSAFLLTGTLDYRAQVLMERMHAERQLTARYAKVIAECLNGRGFVTQDAVVLCDVTYIAEEGRP